jgi:hypothetical protein
MCPLIYTLDRASDRRLDVNRSSAFKRSRADWRGARCYIRSLLCFCAVQNIGQPSKLSKGIGHVDGVDHGCVAHRVQDGVERNHRQMVAQIVGIVASIQERVLATCCVTSTRVQSIGRSVGRSIPTGTQQHTVHSMPRWPTWIPTWDEDLEDVVQRLQPWIVWRVVHDVVAKQIVVSDRHDHRCGRERRLQVIDCSVDCCNRVIVAWEFVRCCISGTAVSNPCISLVLATD